MKQQEWFILGVRLIGVWLVVLGIEELVALVEAKFGLISPTHTALGAYVFHAAVEFSVGAYFLMGGPALVSFAFKSQIGVEPTSDDTSES